MASPSAWLSGSTAPPLASGRLTSLVLVVTILVGVVWLGSPGAYVPHVDDLFIAAWARASVGQSPGDVPEIAEFVPSPEWFRLLTNGHVLALGTAFEVMGLATVSATVYRAALFAITAGLVGWYCWRQNWRLAATVVPAGILLVHLHAGLRFEITALPLMFGGLIGLLLAPARTGRVGVRFAAKLAIVLAPLAAPSALVYGAAALIVAFVRDAILDRRPLAVLEDIVALAVGIVLLGLMIDFRYADFVGFLGSLSDDVPVLTLAPDRLASGLIVLALAVLVWRRSREAGLIAATVGLGNLFALVGHSKMPIATPLLTFAVLALVETVQKAGWQRLIARGGVIAVFTLLFVNQTVFALLSSRDSASIDIVAERARAERDAGRRVLIDEVTAFHALDLDTTGMIGWTWSRRFPLNRPADINEVTAGETWIVSAYTIHGWLKSNRVAGFPGRDAPLAARFPPIGCWFGRNSCDLPRSKWGFYIVTRDATGVRLETVPAAP